MRQSKRHKAGYKKLKEINTTTENTIEFDSRPLTDIQIAELSDKEENKGIRKYLYVLLGIVFAMLVCASLYARDITTNNSVDSPNSFVEYAEGK